jgi:hypothetical protein
MESEGSLPCSQEPSAGPYPALDESSPYDPILSLLRSILMLSSHLRLGLPTGISPSGIPTKNPTYTSYTPCVLYALPISCSVNVWSYLCNFVTCSVGIWIVSPSAFAIIWRWQAKSLYSRWSGIVSWSWGHPHRKHGRWNKSEPESGKWLTDIWSCFDWHEVIHVYNCR